MNVLININIHTFVLNTFIAFSFFLLVNSLFDHQRTYLIKPVFHTSLSFKHFTLKYLCISYIGTFNKIDLSVVEYY